MTLATLTLLLPLATANPTKMNIVATPGCQSCPTVGAPVQSMLPPAWPAFPQPCPPTAPPAPVLFTKIIVPAGVNITTHAGSGMAKTFVGYNTFGFRPGYRYRLQLNNLNLPSKPGASLFPVVEVFGSLVPRGGLNYWEFPAPVTFSETDLVRAASGYHVIKVIYLEDPKKVCPSRPRRTSRSNSTKIHPNSPGAPLTIRAVLLR